MMPRKVTPQVADHILARELALSASNDADIYRQRLVPFAQMFAKKIRKGTFDQHKAEKALGDYLARDVLKWYWKQYDADGVPPTLNATTKLSFGKVMWGEIEEMTKDMAAGRTNPTPTLTTAQEAEMRRVKAYFPYRIVSGTINKDTGLFEVSAHTNMRIPNKLTREGHTVFLLK